jgi:hypothetical protein
MPAGLHGMVLNSLLFSPNQIYRVHDVQALHLTLTSDDSQKENDHLER